jgi:hypothetical protein
MNFDRKFLIWALSYAVAGMCLGLYMAASKNHGELVAHAHILLIGFALSLFYGLIHKLWLPRPPKTVARVQFVLHQAGAFVVSLGLLLLYGGLLPDSTIGPILGVSAAGVLVAALLMLYMVVKAGVAASAAPAPQPD